MPLSRTDHLERVEFYLAAADGAAGDAVPSLLQRAQVHATAANASYDELVSSEVLTAEVGYVRGVLIGEMSLAALHETLSLARSSMDTDVVDGDYVARVHVARISYLIADIERQLAEDGLAEAGS